MLDWSKPGAKYAEMATDFLRLMGIRSGGMPVVSRKAHPQQYREWYAYYGFRRLLASQQMMREKDEKSVPTLSPFDFDAEFVAPLALPEVPREGEGRRHEPTPEERKRVEILMSRLTGRKPDAPKAQIQAA